MLNRSKLTALALVMLLVAFGGCGTESPQAPVPSSTASFPSLEELEAMSTDELFEVMRTAASDVPMGEPSTSEFTTWQEFFPELADAEEGSRTKQVPLPEQLLVAITHAKGMNGINYRHDIPELTHFFESSEGHWGFQLAWTEQQTTGLDKFYLLADFPVGQPAPTPVAPTTKPVYDSAIRVGQALYSPKDLQDKYYGEFGTLVDYQFKYLSNGVLRQYNLLWIDDVTVVWPDDGEEQ